MTGGGGGGSGIGEGGVCTSGSDTSAVVELIDSFGGLFGELKNKLVSECGKKSQKFPIVRYCVCKDLPIRVYNCRHDERVRLLLIRTRRQ